jgi:hypothetical protein
MPSHRINYELKIYNDVCPKALIGLVIHLHKCVPIKESEKTRSHILTNSLLAQQLLFLYTMVVKLTSVYNQDNNT